MVLALFNPTVNTVMKKTTLKEQKERKTGGRGAVCQDIKAYKLVKNIV